METVKDIKDFKRFIELNSKRQPAAGYREKRTDR